MDQEALSTFVGSHVKLVLKPHFILRGKIKQVFSDSILFETTQCTSIISFDRISEVSTDTWRQG